MKKLLCAVALAACAVFGANAATLRVAGDQEYTSIQDAIDAASDGDTILVGWGTYEAIDTQGKNITIRSTHGAEKTIIVGGKKALGGNRNATAALLMSDAVNNSIYDSDEDPSASGKYDVVKEWSTWTPEDLPGSTLEGFTIQVDSLGFAPTYDGEIFGVVGGRVKNCRFICPTDRNIGGYAHMNCSVAENCLFVSGELAEEVISDSILRNCTVYTKTFICASAMENTIVYGCSDRVDLDEAERPTLANCVFYGVSGVSGRSGVTVADPLFVDAANGDFRIKAGSPCIDKGGTVYGEIDLAGNPRVINGTVDVGCYEYKKEQRVVCHYPVVNGIVGQELRKPNGDHYFDVDFFDFDTAPDKCSEDGNLAGIDISPSCSWFSTANYNQDVKETPTDSQSWYQTGDSYHPFIATPTEAGTWNVKLTFTWSDGHTETVSFQLVITAVPTVIASAADVSVSYDGAAHGISVSVKSPTSGVKVEYAESAEGPWLAASPTVTDAGSAKVWYRALAEGYLGVTNSETVTVSPRPISNATLTLLGIPEESYKYDGTAKTPAVSVTDTISDFVSSSDYDAPVYSDNVNAGTAKVVVTGVGNYAGTVEATFAIAKRSLTFTSASAEWAWDGEAHSCETTPTVGGDGFAGSDGATFSGFKSVTAPGSYENTFSYAFTDGTVASNYDITTAYGTLRIFNYKATVKEDGTMRIDGLGDEPLGSSELVIPEEIDGKKVTEVAEGAFANSTCGATSLTLAKFCKKIGANAFRGIGTLCTVTFVQVYETDGVTEATLEIGANAFNSTEVGTLAVPDYVQAIGDYAFANCGSLKRVSVGPGTVVSTKAFYRSGIAAGKKPEVISLGAFSVDGSVATMKVTGTGGTIDVTGLKVSYATSLGADAAWTELEYRTSETVLTETGCELTVSVDVPSGMTSAFFRAEIVE